MKLGRFANRVWLFVRIVGRIDQSETRMMPGLAWEVSGIIHPQVEPREKARPVPDTAEIKSHPWANRVVETTGSEAAQRIEGRGELSAIGAENGRQASSGAGLKAPPLSNERSSITPTEWELDLAKGLHINYCEELAAEGNPWEVPAENELHYFATLKEAVMFFVTLPHEAPASATGPGSAREFYLGWCEGKSSPPDVYEFAEAYAESRLSAAIEFAERHLAEWELTEVERTLLTDILGKLKGQQ